MGEKKHAKLPYRKNVGVMLVNAEKKVFTAQRLDFQSDAWQMPQGGIDKDEKPKEAALRELFEETNVSSDKVEIVDRTKGWLTYDLPEDILPQIWGGKYRGQKQKWFLMKFLGDDSDINIDSETPEFSQWRWSAHDELVDLIVPFKRDVYAQVVESFRYYFEGQH